MALKDTWIPRIDGVNEANASDINEIADAVIDLENQGTPDDVATIDYVNNAINSAIGEALEGDY